MVGSNTFKRQDFLSWEILEDGIAVIVDEHEGKVYRFNGIGSEIWKSLDGTNSTEVIIKNLTTLYDASEKKIKKDTEKIINELFETDLIEKVS